MLIKEQRTTKLVEVSDTVEPRSMDTHLIPTPGYNGQFRLFQWKRSSFIFSKFNLLSTDTRFTWTLWQVPSVSILMGFHCMCILLCQ